ncbi:MAG: 50S ribosomal protein L23 [Planctomycetota bacterium]
MAETASKTKLVLRPDQVILRPLVTEKGIHRATRHNQYAFEVNPLAVKADVRSAVETLFNVRVVSVATQNRKGKKKRHKFRMVPTRNWKKAIVTLNPEDRISLF